MKVETIKKMTFEEKEVNLIEDFYELIEQLCEEMNNCCEQCPCQKGIYSPIVCFKTYVKDFIKEVNKTLDKNDQIYII